MTRPTPRLTRRIGGREVVLGYSVPTRYAGTSVPPWEFAGWPVHLLGGSPHRQIAMAHYLSVVSADGNYINRKATQFCEWWNGRRWITLRPKQADAPYEAFRRSCVNVLASWRDLAPTP